MHSHLLPQRLSTDPMGSVMGAGVDAERLAAVTEIAIDGLLGYRGDHASVNILLVFGHQLNCSIGAVTLAQSAADTVVFDHHFQMIVLTMDGIYRATIHAIGLMARTTRSGNQELPKP